MIVLWIENIVCSELALCESFEDIKWQFCFLFPQAVIKSDRKSFLITLVHLVPVLWKGVKTGRGPWWSVLDYSVSKDLSANKIFEHRTLWWSGLTDQLWRWSLWSAVKMITLISWESDDLGNWLLWCQPNENAKRLKWPRRQHAGDSSTKKMSFLKKEEDNYSH